MLFLKKNYPPVIYFYVIGFFALLGFRITPAINQLGDGLYWFAGYTLYGIAALIAVRSIPAWLHAFKYWRAERNAKDTAFKNARLATGRDLRRGKLNKLTPDGIFLGTRGITPICYTGDSHILCLAPNGTGKTTTTVLNCLAHNVSTSILVIDTKGELEAMTAQHRADHGQDIRVVKPWGNGSDTLNPFEGLISLYIDPITRGDCRSEAEELAFMLVKDRPNDNNPHFSQKARAIITDALLHLATRGEPQFCNPATLWEVVNNPVTFAGFVEEMCKSKALSGTISDAGEGLNSLIKNDPEMLERYMTNARLAVKSYSPDGAIADNTTTSTFSFADMKNKPTTVYLQIPPEKLASGAAHAGVLIHTAIRQLTKEQQGRVIFLLDEFTATPLGSKLPETLVLLRSYGCQLFMIAQSYSEIVRVYGEQVAQTILNESAITVSFGFQSFAAAKACSDLVGTHTIRSKSMSYNPAQLQSSPSLGERETAVLPPHDLLSMHKDMQIITAPNMPAIKGRRRPYWEMYPFCKWIAPLPGRGRPAHKPKVWLFYAGRPPKWVARLLVLPKMPQLHWTDFVRGFFKTPAKVLVTSALVAVICFVGTPHLLYNKQHCKYIGLNGIVQSHETCERVGVFPFADYLQERYGEV